MCHFLTIAVPAKTIPEVPEEFYRTIHFTKHTNRSVTEHMPHDWTSFTATSGGCSCDFYQAPNDAPDENFKLEKKYRKKGWSDSKIQRALESHKTESTQFTGLRDDILELVTEFTNTFREVRLSLHWYSGDVEAEDFSLNDVGSISLEDFKRDTTALGNETTIKIKCEQGGAGQRR